MSPFGEKRHIPFITCSHQLLPGAFIIALILSGCGGGSGPSVGTIPGAQSTQTGLGAGTTVETGTTQNPGPGTTQNSGSGTTQNSGPGTTQNSGSGTTQNSGSGATQNPGSGTTQNSGSGATQNPGSGATQNPGSGTTQNSGPGATQNPGSGTTQNSDTGTTQNPGSGTTQNSDTGTTQNSGTGATQNSDTGTTQNSGTSTNRNPRAEAIRAAIARGSATTLPSAPAPRGITLTRDHNARPTIDIESNSPDVVDWSSAGSAPVPSGTRLYDGYRLARTSGVIERTVLSDNSVFSQADGVPEKAWVWTDIQSPSYEDFTDVYTLNHDTDSNGTKDALVVESEHLGLITHIARDPRDTRGSDSTSVNPVDRGILGQATTFNQGHQISARFDDAYGIYTCIQATCSIDMTGNKLRPLVAATGWAFIPKAYAGAGNGARPPQVLVHDTDYRYFGLWLRGPNAGNGGRFDIQTFAGGSEPFSGSVTTLTGRATYVGPAGGQYVKDTGNGGAAAGLFTAKVTLHADFGASPVIHGSMRNFRGGGRNLKWSLSFAETAIMAKGTFDGTTSGTTLVEGSGSSYIGDPSINTGTYGGKFYGNGDNGYPNGAVGTFTGKFNDGLVIGAFGGSREVTNP